MSYETTENKLASQIATTYENLTLVEQFLKGNKKEIVSNGNAKDSSKKYQNLLDRVHNAQHLFWGLDRIANNPRIGEKSSWIRLDKKYLSWMLGNRQQYLYESLEKKLLIDKLERVVNMSSEIKDLIDAGELLEPIEKYVNHKDELADHLNQISPIKATEQLLKITDICDSLWANLPPFGYINIKHKQVENL